MKSLINFLKETLSELFLLIPYVAGFVAIIYFGAAVFEWMREHDLSGVRRIFIYLLGGIALKMMLKEYFKNKK